MYCEECGKKIPDDSRFCDGCGAPVRPQEEPSYYDGPVYHDAPVYNEEPVYQETPVYGKQPVYTEPPRNPYDAPVPGGMIPEKEKKSTGTTVLIAVLSVVAVALVVVLIFLGIRFFGGNGEKATDKAVAGQTSVASLEADGEKENVEEETKPDVPSIAPSTNAAMTTAPTTAAVTMPSSSQAADAEYILPNSNSAYLTEADLAGLTKEQLRLARNEIYARRGRKFKDQELNEYFLSKSWYTPLYEPDQFSESVFNDYELANRKLIADYEKKMGY